MKLNMKYIVFILFFFLSACIPIDDEIENPLDLDVTSAEVDFIPEYLDAERNPSYKDSDTLRLAMRPPLTLNPLLNEDVTVDHILKLIFEPLVILDESLKPSEHLAAFNFASDYSSVNLTLRRDAIWSDTMPVTADDVLFSINVLQNAPDTAIYKRNVENIASCEKLDSKSVKITFKEIYSGSAYLLQFPIIPLHYYQNETNPLSERNMSPLGNGLYAFNYLRPLDYLSLQSNVYTFRPVTGIQTVEAVFIPDFKTELHAFNQGMIDALVMELTEWSKQISVKKTRHEEYPAMFFDFIGFNFDHPLLSIKTFRQGLATAYDADEAISRIYLNHAYRSRSPVNPASWLYDDTISVNGFDPAAARDFLWMTRLDEPDLYNEMEPLRILVNEENDERIRIAEGFAAALLNMNLEVVLEIHPFEIFMEKLEEGDYDIFVGSFYLNAIPDLAFAFHSGGNIFNYSDPEMDALLAAAEMAGSESEHFRTMSGVQYYIAEELPVISLAFRHSAVLTDERVQGDLKPSLWNTLAGVNGWGLE